MNSIPILKLENLIKMLESVGGKTMIDVSSYTKYVIKFGQ